MSGQDVIFKQMHSVMEQKKHSWQRKKIASKEKRITKRYEGLFDIFLDLNDIIEELLVSIKKTSISTKKIETDYDEEYHETCPELFNVDELKSLDDYLNESYSQAVDNNNKPLYGENTFSKIYDLDNKKIVADTSNTNKRHAYIRVSSCYLEYLKNMKDSGPVSTSSRYDKEDYQDMYAYLSKELAFRDYHINAYNNLILQAERKISIKDINNLSEKNEAQKSIDEYENSINEYRSYASLTKGIITLVKRCFMLRNEDIDLQYALWAEDAAPNPTMEKLLVAMAKNSELKLNGGGETNPSKVTSETFKFSDYLMSPSCKKEYIVFKKIADDISGLKYEFDKINKKIKSDDVGMLENINYLKDQSSKSLSNIVSLSDEYNFFRSGLGKNNSDKQRKEIKRLSLESKASIECLLEVAKNGVLIKHYEGMGDDRVEASHSYSEYRDKGFDVNLSLYSKLNDIVVSAEGILNKIKKLESEIDD